MTSNSSYLTPKEIVQVLDKYIIGQKAAKRNVAIALRNRWRRMHVTTAIRNDIIPNNILMIGTTGVGKTEIARRLAKIADAPFIKVEASKFTEVGYVGRDVESMVRDLVGQAITMVKTQYETKIKEKATKIVEQIILNILVPPIEKNTQNPDIDNKASNVDVDNKKTLQNEETRAYFSHKLRQGALDKKTIEINITQSQTHGVGMIGGGMVDESSMMNLQDMLSNMLPKKKKKKTVSIAEAKKILLEEEMAKMVDMDLVKEKALHKAANTGIIFIDEIDKIATKSNKDKGPDVSREGVQRDLLPIVEGSAVNTKYGIIHTDHILFIAAGAFHTAKPSDLIPEFQGRFPIRVELENLTQEDFYRILKEPKNALIKQYQALFDVEEVTLSFEKDALQEIAHIAFQINENLENIGARRLHTVMSHLLNNFLFDVPDLIKASQKIHITKQLVTDTLSELVKSKDLSEYIL